MDMLEIIREDITSAPGVHCEKRMKGVIDSCAERGLCIGNIYLQQKNVCKKGRGEWCWKN